MFKIDLMSEENKNHSCKITLYKRLVSDLDLKLTGNFGFINNRLEDELNNLHKREQVYAYSIEEYQAF